MTRQVCIPYAIAVRHAVENVGKIVASSKQRYTWEFKFPGSSASNFITMTWSGSNVKVFKNDEQIFTKPQNSFFRGGTVFEHIFPVKNVEYRLLIERAPLDSKTARDGGPAGNGAIAKLYVGGTLFEDLPKSQREYDLKHSKELIRNLRRRTGSTASVRRVLNFENIHFHVTTTQECHSNQVFLFSQHKHRHTNINALEHRYLKLLNVRKRLPK